MVFRSTKGKTGYLFNSRIGLMVLVYFQKFPDLKFKYVEEDSPEQFFVPYVWQIICNNGSIHFNSESMKQATDVAC